LIRTADGDRKIEDLAVGDLLPTCFAGICPIQWIGYYPAKRSNPAEPWAKNLLPVRVARSALGPNVPRADLYVTTTHALLVDDVLVTAGSLINGTTISLYDATENDQLEFFHIKLARHNVIYANGAPCETVMNFDEGAVNFVEYLRRYGPPTAQEAPCAPLLSLIGRRSEIKSRFRSAVAPWMDRRQKVDIIRDELEERGIVLSRQQELLRGQGGEIERVPAGRRMNKTAQSQPHSLIHSQWLATRIAAGYPVSQLRSPDIRS
jgi:hypothetical protein